MKNHHVMKAAATLFTSLSLFACGGGDEGADGKTAVSNKVEYGVFSDSIVSNLTYRTDSQQGVTDENGYFKYKEGEQITFSIGNMTFPPVYAGKIITPLELVGTANTDNQAVTNMIRLLQTLDTDKNPENGISIDPNAQNSAQEIDFSLGSEEFENAVADFLMDLSIEGGLVSTEQARSHFSNSLNHIIANRSAIISELAAFTEIPKTEETEESDETDTEQSIPSLLGKVVYISDRYGDTCYNFNDPSIVSVKVHDVVLGAGVIEVEWFQDGVNVVIDGGYETWIVINEVANIWRVSRAAVDQDTTELDIYVADSFSEIATQLNIQGSSCLN